MRGQNRQMRGGRRFRDKRGGKRFNDRRGGRDNEDQPARFRRGSRDFSRKSDRGSNRGGPRTDRRDQIQRSGDRSKRITKDGRKRIPRDGKRDNDRKPSRDLDGQLMNYWVKSGRKTDQQGKNLAQLKLNQDLDNYWKQKDQNAQKVQQKKKQ